MTKRKPLTEADWLSSKDSYAMMAYLQQHRRITRVPGGKRRLRLFSCACCRHIWPALTDARSRRAVEVTERAADGQARKTELQEALEDAQAAMREAQARFRQGGKRLGIATAEGRAVHAAGQAACAAEWTARGYGGVRGVSLVLHQAQSVLAFQGPGTTPLEMQATRNLLSARQADLVRDIFGNPFAESPTIAPAWRTWNGGAAVKMARGIYDNRDFAALPVLADLLEEVGCDDPKLLAHGREPGEHARGCWLLDAILERA